MPASEVQGPLGLQLNIPSHIPGTRHPVAYNAPEDQIPPLGRSRSQPIGESSQGPSYSRRTQSENSLNIPVTMHTPRSPPPADNAASEQPATAPSPVPTEIIPPELTQEEIVVDIQQSGIKVCDFAYEGSSSPEQCAPELFDPILGWHVYEAVLENPNPERGALNGRHLRRLLDIGWVSEEEDGHRWLKRDREALEQFDSRPHYPWKALRLTKPKKDELREVATSRFQWINAEQLLPQFVNRGITRLAAVLRGPRNTSARYQKRAANDTTETEPSPELSPRSKKRRLSTGGHPSESRPAPTSSVHFPLTLVNGKPPPQYAPGRSSGSSPSTSALPTQGTLSRSLQRHLSMSSITSSCSTDFGPSDSRTTLTQNASHE